MADARPIPFDSPQVLESFKNLKVTQSKNDERIFNILGSSTITLPPLNSLYSAEIRKSKDYPDSSPSMSLTLQLPSEEDLENEEKLTKITSDMSPEDKQNRVLLKKSMAVRRWLNELRTAVIEAIARDPSVLTKITGKTISQDPKKHDLDMAEARNTLNYKFEPIYKDPAASRSCPVPTLPIVAQTFLKKGMQDPPKGVLEVNQENYTVPARFYTIKKGTQVEIDYNTTPKYKCVRGNALVQPNVQIGWVSVVSGIVRLKIKLVDSILKYRNIEPAKQTAVDVSVMGGDDDDQQQDDAGAGGAGGAGGSGGDAGTAGAGNGDVGAGAGESGGDAGAGGSGGDAGAGGSGGDAGAGSGGDAGNSDQPPPVASSPKRTKVDDDDDDGDAFIATADAAPESGLPFPLKREADPKKTNLFKKK